MATDIDTLLAPTPTKTKRMKVGFTFQHLAFQAAGQCSAICPTCRNSCELPGGHQGNHQCSNGHQWASDVPGPREVPGPH